MKFCYECGYRLDKGTEKFCPECGENLKNGIGTKSNNASLIESEDKNVTKNPMGIEDKYKLVEPHWQDLLTSIYEKKCIPFIGESSLEFFNQVYDERFTTNKELARELAIKYDYPLEDCYELPKITQFLEITSEDPMYSKHVVSGLIKKRHTPDFSLGEFRNTPYSVLADLNLPIYITTNYDYFMEKALKSKGKEPVSEFCRWNEPLYRYTKEAGICSVFDNNRTYTPTVSEPVVYHLHGIVDVPQSMVLTEQDYHEFVINNNRNNANEIFPAFLQKGLVTSSLVFIGYSVHDISLRSIFQGPLSLMSNVSNNRTNIAVIQVPSLEYEISKQQKVLGYLELYFKKMFNTLVYWELSNQFIKELLNRWITFRENMI